MNYGDFTRPKEGYNSTTANPNGYNTSYLPVNPGDDLAGLSVEEKRNFYQRLAYSAILKDSESLAGKTLLYWLSKPTTGLVVENKRVKDLVSVNDYLYNEVRQVILSQKEAFLSGKRVGIRGVIDRLLGLNGRPRWDRHAKIEIHYEGPSFELVTLAEFEGLQSKVIAGKILSKEEEIKSDVFNSFHESGMSSDVVLSVKEIKLNKVFDIEISSWKSKIIDDYNWDISLAEQAALQITNKKLTLPNPDFKNPFNASSPVAPHKKFIVIHHSNAKDVEDEGYAKPFKFETKEWEVTNPKVIEKFTLNVDH